MRTRRAVRRAFLSATRALIVSAVLGAFVVLASQLTEWRTKMQPLQPRSYFARFAASPPKVDGNLDDPAWRAATWTEDFVDIQGPAKSKPSLRTRAKLTWDDHYLYVGAELEEPHVWATITNHDAVIFQDPDFEVFIDPDGDTHRYYEFEMNALNTGWDLFLDKPYQDQGKPRNEWEIPGLKTAVQINGTLNNAADEDSGWTVEMAFPWEVLSEHAAHPGPPQEGEQWRIGFSRVEWQVTTNGGRYQKLPKQPEDNWVWSPQGVIDMHRPEKWGVVHFTRKNGNDQFALIPLPGVSARDLALEIYYAQRDFQQANGRWATQLAQLQWEPVNLPAGVEPPKLEKTSDGYTCSVRFREGDRWRTWSIRQDRLLNLE